MSFCEYCGRPLAEGEVCDCTQSRSSGQEAAQTEAVHTDTAQTMSPESFAGNVPASSVKPKKKGKKGLVAALLVRVLIVVGGVAALFYICNGYKKPINDITTTINKQTEDVDAIVTAFLPDFAVSPYRKAVRIMKTSEAFTEAYASVGKALSGYYEQLDADYENGWKVKFDYTDREKLETEELESIEDAYSALYERYFETICDNIEEYDKYDYEDLAASLGIADSKAKELCKVAVNFMKAFEDPGVTAGYTLTGRIVLTDNSGETLEKSEKMKIKVIKLNGDWMIDYLSLMDEMSYDIRDLHYMLDGLN